jgi:mannose-6-phosphate isomerase-like protein (cupin superfamily)
LSSTGKQAKVFRSEEIAWQEPEGHIRSALSKLLINPDNSDAQYLDFRISCFQPRASAEAHTHEEAENIYYILKGRGVVVLDGQEHLVEPHMIVFMPPGVEHSIMNTGYEDLIYVFVAAPAYDQPRDFDNGDTE